MPAHPPPPLFPMSGGQAGGSIILFFLLAFASAGGLGGGAVVVPVLLVFFKGMEDVYAVPIAACVMFAGSLVNITSYVMQRHPKADRPMIDWELLGVMEMQMIAGALVGTLIEKTFPKVALETLMVVLLMYMSYRLAIKFLSQREKEAKEREANNKIADGTVADNKTAKKEVELGGDKDSSEKKDGGGGGGEGEVASTARESVFDILTRPSSVEAADSLGTLGINQMPPIVYSREASQNSQNSRSSRSSLGGMGIANSSGINSPFQQEQEQEQQKKKVTFSQSVDKVMPNPIVVAPPERKADVEGGDDDIKPRTPEEETELKALLESEKVTSKLFLIKFVGFGFFGMVILAGVGTTQQCGSVGRWGLWAFLLIWVMLVGFVLMRDAYLNGLRKTRLQYEYLPTDVPWTVKNITGFPPFCFFAGLISSALGIGGSMITGPILLELGVHPQVSAATSATMVSFTAATSIVAFGLQNQIVLDYALFFSGLAMGSCILGQSAGRYFIMKFKAPSLVMLAVTIVAGSGAFFLFIHMMIMVTKKDYPAGYFGFEPYCPKK